MMIFLCLSVESLARVRPDTLFSVQELKEIPAEKLELYRNSPEYLYTRGINYEANIFKRAWRSFKEKLRKALGISSAAGINEILFYLIIILAVTGLVYHLLRSQSSGLWQRKSVSQGQGDLFLLDDNVNSEHIDQLIREAVGKEDYRLAIRMHFTKVIKTLKDAGIIAWKPAMTNYDILHMVQSEELKPPLKDLTLIFEHIWYGYYKIENLDHYLRYNRRFEIFIKKLSTVHGQ